MNNAKSGISSEQNVCSNENIHYTLSAMIAQK